MFGKIHQWEHTVLDFYLVRRFFITNSLSLLIISLFRLSVSSCSDFGRFYVSRNLSISFLTLKVLLLLLNKISFTINGIVDSVHIRCCNFQVNGNVFCINNLCFGGFPLLGLLLPSGGI